MKRKLFSGILALLLGLGCCFAHVAAAEDNTVTLLIHPTLYSATGGDNGIIQRFMDETGIDVTIVSAPTQDLRDKALMEFLSASGRFDVILLLSGWLNDDMFQYLEPLDEYLAQASEGYQPEDFIESLMAQGKDSAGVQKVIPMRVGTAMMYYNQDILSAHGLTVPTTWEEVLEVCEAVSTEELKGIAQTFYPENKDFIRLLYSMGGTVLSEDMTQATVNTPEMVQMINFVKTIFDAGYVSKESLTWDRDQQITAMQQGRAALGVYYSPYWGRIIDETAIAEGYTADSFGWALSPTSEGVPAGRSLNDGWSVGIDKNSQHKENAWKLVEALTNAENQLEMALYYANGPTRTSVYQSEEYLAMYPLAEEWLTATAASMFVPPHPDWELIQSVLNRQVFYAIDGSITPEEAAQAANDEIQRILDNR